LQGFVNSTSKFNVTVVKTLNRFFNSVFVVSLQIKNMGDEITYLYGLFEPGFDHC
jgi:hypothetical protein